MKKILFLFPGQGAQYTGMGLDLLEKGGGSVAKLFDTASEASGRDMKTLLASDAETLKRSDVSQPAITLVNLAAATIIAERGAVPAGAAGFSLGEYAALVVAGVISAEDCFRLVTERGRVMQAVCDDLAKATGDGKKPGMAKPTFMAAVIGLAPDKVEALVNNKRGAGEPWGDLYAANFNSPRQTVVSGTAAALEAAAEYFKAEGAKRFIPIAVAGPFHCPLMKKAAENFAPILDKINFKDPILPLYSNVSGKIVATGDEAKRLALSHITSPVRWTDEEQAFEQAPGAGFDAAAEVGPGKTLQGLWRDSGRGEPCLPAGTFDDIEKLFADGGENS